MTVSTIDRPQPHRARAPMAMAVSVRSRPPAVWLFRALILVPFVFMAPLVMATIVGKPGAFASTSAATADVLGTSSCVAFFLMLSVTPTQTLTGWRWHLVLRRDLGLAMFAIACSDLTLAAITTGDTFPGGLMSRVAGRALLVAGTAAVVMCAPLAFTANRRAQRWLGPHWKRVHRLTYVVWGLILLHLLLLFGLRTFFLDALVMSAPLVLVRAPRVRNWFLAARRAGRQQGLRLVASLVVAAVFLIGLYPFLNELVKVGSAAFAQHPILD